MGLFSVLSKCSLGSLGLYSYYKFSPSQRQADIEGYFNSSINSLFAARVLASSVIDYKYSLHGMEYTSDAYHERRSEVHYRVARRILSLSVRSRGIYFKAGQYLGNLDRIMPREFTEILCVLQDSAPPLDYEVIKTVLENDMPGVLEQFQSFDKVAIAAASLAQVHRAQLKTGEVVAVKIQYPFLAAQTSTDFVVLKLLTHVCNWLLRMNDFQDVDLLKIWGTFKDMCIQEVDFLHEKYNSEKTKKIFEGDDSIHVPMVYGELSCSRVLTMEFVKGVKVSDNEGIEQMGFDTKEVAKMIINAFGKMIFIEGHVHCDPHPGNILIREFNGKPQVILLDHGFYRYIPDEFRIDFCNLWHALVELDYETVKRIAEKMGLGDYYRYLPMILTFRTMDSKKPLGEVISQEERKQLHAGNMITFEKITQLMQRLPPDMIFIIRTSNLIALQNLRLGGTTRERLMIYTDYSFRALYSGFMYYWEIFKYYFLFIVLHKL